MAGPCGVLALDVTEDHLGGPLGGARELSVLETVLLAEKPLEKGRLRCDGEPPPDGGEQPGCKHGAASQRIGEADVR